jgi:hypothetical protein
MPLQNRVTPFGELIASSARGQLFGNRGGRLHDEQQALRARRWVSRAWICCRLEFKGRHRKVWGDGYTELFFLDEVTALAAGHRPCFECRRHAAQAFAAAWARAAGLNAVPRAGEMDAILHAQRLTNDGPQGRRSKRLHRLPMSSLPDGAVVTLSSTDAWAVRGTSLLRWTPYGYAGIAARPQAGAVDVLTPPSTLGALAAGFASRWHPSAGTFRPISR